MIHPWPLKSSEYLADCRIFKVRKDLVTDPRNGADHEMFVLEHPNWVNILPLTNDGRIILVRQWRQGTRSVELETPGGMVDPGEAPTDCAGRELLEETGYQAERLTILGEVKPNPAYQDNQLHYVLADGCHKVAEPSLDHAEDLEVVLVPIKEIPQLIARGEIMHSIVVAGLYHLHLAGKIA